MWSTALSLDFTSYKVETDETGRFAISQVPPGSHRIARVDFDPDGSPTLRPAAYIEALLGETISVVVELED